MTGWGWTGDGMESSRLERGLSAAASWPWKHRRRSKQAHGQGSGRLGLEWVKFHLKRPQAMNNSLVGSPRLCA